MAQFLTGLDQYWSVTWRLRTPFKEQPHSEPLEIRLGGSLTTTELKKPHPFRLEGVAEKWNGLVPHPCMVDVWWIKIWERYLRNEEYQSHTRIPKAGFQYQEDKTP